MPESAGGLGCKVCGLPIARLIGLRFLWFDPGRTRFPVGMHGRHWVQSARDPGALPQAVR